MNDAEKLISRLTLPPEPDADEDSAFETGQFFIIDFKHFIWLSFIT